MKRFWLIAILFVSASAAPALAGITVTSYSTLAETNGFAPSLQGPYFAQQTRDNVTPALAQVSGDWIGPNANGTPDTWHWVGTSRASSTTAFDANSYIVTADGSFAHTLDTTAAFIDPRPTVLSPGSAANYEGFFTLDRPAIYSITAQLNRLGRIRLSSFEGLIVFDQININSTPRFVELTGMLPPGHYDFLATTGSGPPNLPNGVHHFADDGSYQDVLFTVQVPEPNVSGVVTLIVAARLRKRPR